MGYFAEYQKKKKEEGKSNPSGGSYYKKWVAENRGAELAADMQSRVQSWMDEHSTFVKSYSDRFGGWNGDYSGVNYVTDAQSWYDDMSAKGSTLNDTASKLLADLQRDSYIYGDDYVKAVSEMLTSGRELYTGVADIAKSDVDFWSQFEPTEEQTAAGLDTAQKVYDTWRTDNKYRTKHEGKNRDEINRAILYAEDEQEADWLRQRATELWTSADEQARHDRAEAERNRLYTVGGEDYFDSQELRRMNYLLDTTRDAHNEVERLKVQEKYGTLPYNEDFERYSAYDPAIATGDYAYLNMSKEERVAYRRESIYADIEKGNETGDSAAAEYFEKLDQLTADEIAVYNYLYKKNGVKEATAYLEWMSDTMQWRVDERVAQMAADYANAHPFAASAFSVATSLGSGFEYVKDAAGYLADKALGNPNAKIETNTSSLVTNAIRSKASEKTNWMIGNWDAFDFLYNTGMSGLDSLAASTVFGNGGGVVLGLSAAAQGTQDALNRGMSNDKAFWNGIFTGVFEGLFETYSIGNFNALKEISPKSIKNVFKNIGKSMLVNASEETLTEIANIGYDTLINGEFANYTWEDLRNGAWKDALGQVVEAGGSGALMGLGMGGTGSAIGYVGGKLENTTSKVAQTENTVPGDGVKYSIKRTQGMSWAQQIEGALSKKGTIARNDTLVLDDTPAMLVNDGVASKKLAIPLSVVTKAKSGKDASHSIMDANLKDLQRGVRNAPVVINNPARNALVFVTDIQQDGKPVLVAFQQNTEFDGDDVHKATSIHLQMDVASMLKALPSEATVYVRNESELDTAVGVADSLRSLAANVKFTEGMVTQSVAGVNGENVDPVAQLAREMVEARYAEEDGNSAEGRAILDDEAVDVVDIADVGGGKVTVKLADGRSVDATALEYEDSGEAELWRVIGQYAENAEAARALLQEYRNGDLDAYKYARGIEEAFLFGKLNLSPGEMEIKDSMVNDLSAAQRNVAYTLGKRAGEKKAQQTKQQQENVDAVYKQAKSVLQQKGTDAGEHGVQLADGLTEEKMGKSQHASYELAKMIAPGVKANTRIYNGGKEWGYYDPKSDTICLNINAKWSGASMMSFTLAHELVHRAKLGSIAKYQAFADFLVQQYGEQGAPVNDMVQEQLQAAEENGISMTYEQAFDEVICDACQRMLLDTDAGQRLAEFGAKSEQNKSVVKQFGQWLKELMQKLRRIFRNVEPDYLAAQEFQKFDDNVKQILADMFVDMSMDAGEKLSTIKAAGMTEKITTGEGGVRYKFGMSDADIKAVQNIGRISVNQFSAADIKKTERFAQQYWKEMGAKSPFFRAWFGDWRANDQTKVQIATQKGSTRGVQKNTDTGWDIQVSGKVFNETKVHTESYNKAARPYLPYINDIVRKAVLLDSFGIGQGKMKSPNSLLMHSLYAVADIGNGMEIIKLYVEEMNNPNAADTSKRAYQLQNIEKYHLAAKSSQNTASSISAATSGTVSTVADLFAAVKQKDASFQPKPVSKVVNADGTPKRVFHGSVEMFNTFSYGHIGSASGVSFLGDGFYFTDKKSLANNYGVNVYETYLQLRKPYYATEADAYKLNSQELEKKGYDGVILDAPSGKIYMVFQNTQIKSATDNIGTFDGSNPDIRYKLPAGKDAADRGMLVDLFEQMVTDSNEYRELQKYKKNMNRMLALEEKIDRLTEEIKRVSFAEGPRNMEYLDNLKWQRKQAVAELNRYDNILLNLEKSGVLRAMIERNRQMIQQETRDKTREYYRQKNETREAEIRQYYRESRRKAVERHDKAQVRQQIRKDVERLDSLLNKGTKEKNVKLELQEFAGAALRTAKGTFLKNYNEYDMVRNGVNVTMSREQKAVFARAQALLKELDQIWEQKDIEPGPNSIHEKWDPEENLRRDDHEEALKKELAKNMAVLREAGIFRVENELMEDSIADQLMDELMAAYSALKDSESAHVREVFSTAIYSHMEGVKKFLAGKAVKDMTAIELGKLKDMYRMVLHTITTSNDLFAQKRKADVRVLGEEVIGQLRTPGKEMTAEILDTLKKMGWANLKPETALELIGSDTLTEMMQGLYRGEDTYARDLEQARQYAEEQGKKYGRNKWDMKKSVSFAGTKITLGQAMSLYAYTKRKQAQGHLEGEGFTHSSNVRIEVALGKLPIKLPYIMNATRTHIVPKGAYADVAALLTPEQRKYVDAMQDYLSKVMGAKGNEVSMQLYGVRLFEETMYFPLKTASEYREEALGATAGEVKLKNNGFTQKTVDGASNPIVLDDFEGIWAGHVDKMSLYHGFVLPMEDFDRVYNYRHAVEENVKDAEGEVYKTKLVDTNESVKVDIENKMGKAANEYIENFMKQLNGGVRGDSTEKLFSSMVHNFKKTAVLGSLSVSVQQPTAFIRAMAYLDPRDVGNPKDFLGKAGKPEAGILKEMYKYAPVALMKKIGGFDPGLGRTTKDYVFEDKKGITGALDKFLGMFPEKMDEWTWSYIWICTKRQIHRQNPDLKINSEAFLRKVGERFSKIIRDTQVYDSVLTKSQVMRSKNVFMQMATAFMNEPTTSMDMYIRSTLQAKRGKIKKSQAARTYAAVIGSQILTSAVVAFVYALRDDDDDETYWEKYLSAAIGKAWENTMPWYSIPFVKDIFSIFDGYSVERSDMSLITDLYQGWQKLQSDKASPWEKTEAFAGSILNVFGIPLKNVSRDVRGIYNTVNTWITGGVEQTDAGLRHAALEGLTGKKASKEEQLQSAVVENDAKHILRVMASYSTEESAVSALRSAVKAAYLEGNVTEEQVAVFLQAYAGDDTADAQKKVTYWEFLKEHPESELDQSPALKYVEFAEPAGISLDIYTRYVETTADLESDKDEDGKTISGSKRDKVWAEIHKLSISKKQKDALHYAAGYKESSLEDAPWH